MSGCSDAVLGIKLSAHSKPDDPPKAAGKVEMKNNWMPRGSSAPAAQLMSLIMLVFSVSPILAPLSGSFVIQFGDWRTLFYVMAATGVAGLLLVAFVLKETRPKAARTGSGCSPPRALRMVAT